MSLKEKFITVRDNYVINQARNAKFPVFAPSPVTRYQVRFSGRVQHVGFRLEVSELAKRLGVTGFCENMENGDVLAQFQGEENKIQFLIHFMDNLKRIKIRNMKIEVMECVETEEDRGEFSF